MSLPPPHRIPPLGPPKLSARAKVLAAWRGTDLSAAEKAAQPNAKNAGQVVARVLGNLRMDQRRAEAEIVRVWNHLIDPQLTAHAQPTGIHNGTLFVTVDSHTWKDEIVRYRRKEILDRLHHSFGRELIKRISFRVGG